jgi:DNA-directed RNA polymerase specialized sigma subunit
MYTGNNQNEIFKKFVPVMDSLIRENRSHDGRTNAEMVTELVELEGLFRDTLLSSKQGKLMYRDFLNYIAEEKGDVRSAQVYFRERQRDILNRLSNIFETEKYHLFYRYRINSLFATWVVVRYKGPKMKRLKEIQESMMAVRNRLCQNNLPLAINRAKIFWGKTNQIRLDFMDLVQDATEGLLIAIDKFCPEDSSTGVSGVAIGRMTQTMIDDSNDSSLLKLPRNDERIMYRIRNAINKEKLRTDGEILKYVQESFPDVTAEYLATLQNAAQNVLSLDGGTNESTGIIDTLANDDCPEDNLVERDLKYKVRMAMLDLSVMERKVTRLKTGDST